MFKLSFGNSGCNECPFAQYKVRASISLAVDTSRRVQNFTGAGACLHCAVNYTTVDDAATSPSLCIAATGCGLGYELVSSTCQSALLLCLHCGDLMSWLAECAIGYFKDFVANANCLPCDGNTTTQAKGADDSSLCGCMAGQGWNGTNCELCASGSFQSSFGTNACTLCGSGATTLQPASTSSADCLCKPGFELTSGCTGKVHLLSSKLTTGAAQRAHWASGSPMPQI